MNGIVPIIPGSTGPQVANLQATLLRLLDQRLIRTFPSPNRPTVAELQTLTEGLKQDRALSLFGEATTRLVVYYQIQQGLGDNLRGVVEERTAAKLNEVPGGAEPVDVPAGEGFVVSGRVEGARAGQRVCAYDLDFRSEELLGEWTIVDGNTYEIRYSAEQFKLAEKGRADLRVAVCEEGGRPLVWSDVVYNAGPKVTINLTVSPGADSTAPSEYDRYRADLADVLQGMPLIDVASGEKKQLDLDLDFLAGDTRIDRQHLAWLFQATKLAAVETIAIPSTAFYGWFRKGQSTDWNVLKVQPPSALRADLVSAVALNIIPENVAKDIDSILAAIPSAARDQLGALGRAAGVPEHAVTGLLRTLDGPDAVDDAVLTRLVDGEHIALQDAHALGVGISLQRLTGVDAGAVGGLRSALRNQGPALATASELAHLDVDAWKTALDHAGVEPPAGMSRDQHARGVERDVAAAFPRETLAFRLSRVPSGLAQQVELLRKRPSTVRAERSNEAEALHGLFNLHPGLSLKEAVAKAETTEAAVQTIKERIGWMGTVMAANPETDFLSTDFLPDSDDVKRLSFEGLPEEARGMVLGNLKAHQRLAAVAGNVAIASQVMAAGYHSAAALALATDQDIAQKTSLAPEEAVALQAAAQVRANQTAVIWIAAYTDAVTKVATPLRVLPTDSSFFAKLPGYADLFGSQDFCRCDDCQSVVSPAAYFVDLMHYIEQNVSLSTPADPTDHVKHALHLKVRRPDLWTLPLTCANTNDFVPYLDIVNEVLESYIIALKGGDTTTLYQTLANDSATLSLPFSWPLERLEAYLGYFAVSRLEITRLMHGSAAQQMRARLHLSTTEHRLITTPLPGAPGTSVDAAVGSVDLQEFIRSTGLGREASEAVLLSKFVNTDGSGNAPITITIGVRVTQPQTDVQNNIEVIEGLTRRRYDRVNRFVRLWRRLSWTASELDEVLASLSAMGAGRGLDGDALLRIAEMVEAQEKTGLSTDVLLAVVRLIPTDVMREPVSLFDRLFNPVQFASKDGAWSKQPAVSYLHPALGQGVASPADVATTRRLLAAMQIGEQDLVDVIGELLVPLSAAADKRFELNAGTLALLYRHAVAARVLRLSMADLFAAIRLTPDLEPLPPTDKVKRLRSLSDLLTVLRFRAWQTGSGFTLAELSYLVDEAAVWEGTPVKDTADALVAGIAAEKSLEFTDTVLTQVGLSEAKSRAVVAANLATAIAAVPGGDNYRLDGRLDPTDELASLAGVAGVPADTITKIKTTLSGYSAWHVVTARLAARLAIAPDKLAVLTGMVLSGMSDGDRALAVAALQGAGDELSRKALTRFLVRTARLAMLFRAPVFDRTAVGFVSKYKTAFEVGTPVSMAMIKRVVAYAGVASAPDDAYSDAGTPAEVSAVQSVIAAMTPGGPPLPAPSDEELASALRVAPARIKALRPHPVTPNPFDFLAELKALLDLAARLGVGGETLRLAASDDIAELAAAADGVVAAVRARYPDEQTFNEKTEALNDRLRGRKRDALVAYITSEWRTPFSSPATLYQYFLLDVELDGSSRTSRIVAANACLQLYVQRVLMNLEHSPGVRQGGDGVRAAFGNQLKVAEWTWRKQFRVWQANRKVFLYPENYIEPELRDDKTETFRALEDTLLQKQISEQNVLDAYGKYLTEIDQLANLSIVGTYLEERSDAPGGDRLHVFGVTPSEPPIYYYRTVELLDSKAPAFSGWVKVNVQIPVRTVSPIVYQGRLYVFWAEINTRSKNDFVDGNSTFWGYMHRLAVSYSTLRLDGAWTPPQKLSIDHNPGANFMSNAALDSSILVPDPLNEPGGVEEIQIGKEYTAQFPWFPVISLKTSNSFVPRYDTVIHREAVEGYTLRGPQWDTVYPGVSADGKLIMTLRNFHMTGAVDCITNTLSLAYGAKNGAAEKLSALRMALRNLNTQHLFVLEDLGEVIGVAGPPRAMSSYAVRTLLNLASSEGLRGSLAHFGMAVGDEILTDLETYLKGVSAAATTLVLTANMTQGAGSDVSLSHLAAVNGAKTDLVWARAERERVLIHRREKGGGYALHGLTTSLGEVLRERLAGGVSHLLSIPEGELSCSVPYVKAGSVAYEDGTQFTAPHGLYLKEVLFHIPFLIANHQNSQQRCASAQRWYHYLFDPTATDATSSPEDLPWRYLGFRGLASNHLQLRSILTDADALNAYRSDPFSPHAIARLRPSAYQKCIVMKYVDNLLDWGDHLFTQFTMESVGEATLLYVMASDILGPKPAELGACDGDATATRTYESLKPKLTETSDFLIELEHVSPPGKVGKVGTTEPVNGGPTYVVGKRVLMELDGAPVRTAASPSLSWNQAKGEYRKSTAGTPLGQLVEDSPRSGVVAAAARGADSKSYDNLGGVVGGVTGASSPTGKGAPPKDALLPPPFPTIELVASQAAFCIPENKDLRAYWSRVEDRLFKIRNCMDIAGVRRRLDLFAPVIDPRLLVRMKAEGVSLEDVLEATSGNVPPYRFTYLIEKAKQHTAGVQSLGGQLLSALEKRDAEELNRLRAVHEQNLLKVRTQAMKWEIDAADDTLESLKRQRETVAHRIGHLEGLIEVGSIGPELTEQAMKMQAGEYRGIANLQQLIGAILYLIPDLGAPTALKYGGTALGNAAQAFGSGVNSIASLYEIGASSAAQLGALQRRDQEWTNQLQSAKLEAKQVDKQITAAQFRKQIAEQSLDVHLKTIDQTEEVFSLFRERFSNLGRYTWLSAELHRLYRVAFNSAFSMARLAEQALRFERPDQDASATLASNHWDAENSGLVAGERLMMDLQAMERRFIETNYRKLEIEQSFSLAQFAPDSLRQLRDGDGSCTFAIPEVFFDLSYPGHYRRIIKGVRLTIPCVAGPFTNVGAMLRLTSSSWRKAADLEVPPIDIPLRHTVAVAASTAQNDAGVFEFGFRDERFMPFEGAGAISNWKLQLPDKHRAFDYRTISDVILRISYSAEEDLVHRTKVETALADAVKALPCQRLFNVRSDFPSAWAMFKAAKSVNGRFPIAVDLIAQHYPFWMQGNLGPQKVKTTLFARPTSATNPSLTKAGTKDDGTDEKALGPAGTFLTCEFVAEPPKSPLGQQKVYLNSNAIEDLLLLIAWPTP